MFALILLLTTLSGFSNDECDRESLARQCYTQVCSSRRNVPDSPEQLLEEIKMNPGNIPAAVITDIRNYSETLKNARATFATPASPEAYLSAADSIISDSEKSAERITSLVNRIVRFDDKGNPIINNLLSDDDRKKALDGIDIVNRDVDYSIALSTFSENPQPEISDSEGKVMRELIAYYQSKDPARSSALSEYQRLLNARVQVPAEISSKIDIRNGILELRNNYLRSNREALAAIIRMNERHAYERIKETNFNDIIQSCQLLYYLAEKARPLNNPETLSKMAERVFARLDNHFYSKLSSHSAEVLRGILKPELVKLVRSEADYSSFQVPKLNPTAPRDEQINYLSDLKSSRCSMDFIDGDFGGITEDGKEVLISLSPLTLAQNKESALAHELGHAITGILSHNSLSTDSLAKITSLRSCLNRNHAGDQSPPSPHSNYLPGDTLRTDEDFGDWMQATLGYNEDYLGCDLGRILDFGEQERAHPYFSTPQDPHSADLFRNLHIRLLRGSPITTECRELMNQSPEERPVKCEL